MSDPAFNNGGQVPATGGEKSHQQVIDELRGQLAAANIWINTCKNHDPYTAAWTEWKLRAETAEQTISAQAATIAGLREVLEAVKKWRRAQQWYEQLCHGEVDEDSAQIAEASVQLATAGVDLDDALAAAEAAAAAKGGRGG